MEGECATNERTAPPLHACLPACLILLWLAERVTADWLAACINTPQGQHPVVYWTPLGKNTVRMVHTAPVDLPKGG